MNAKVERYSINEQVIHHTSLTSYNMHEFVFLDTCSLGSDGTTGKSLASELAAYILTNLAYLTDNIIIF